MPRSVRPVPAAAGLVGVVLAVPVVGWMTFTPTGHAWAEVVDATMRDRPGAWSVLRAAYAYAVIPALFVALGILVFLAYRHRGSAAAWVLVGVALLSNVTVQFVKLAPLGIGQGPANVDPLSGHIGVAAGVCLGWLVVAPAQWRGRSVAAAAAVLVAVTSGVLLCGWHSPFQLLCPLLMAAGYATLGAALPSSQGPPEGDEEPVTCSGDRQRGRAALASGLLVVAGATAFVLRFQDVTLEPGITPVVVGTAWIAGWCAAAVGGLVLASRSVAPSKAGRPSRRVAL